MTAAGALLVLGRGVVRDGPGFALSEASAARVRAAVGYAERHRTALVVFSGGWDTGPRPPVGWREGDLMLAAARAAGLRSELRAETRSRSTLENLLYTIEERLLGDVPFTAARPLGLVSHRWHLPRVRDLAGKVLGLRGAALLDVPVADADTAGGAKLLRLGSRLCFAGATSAAALRRRERVVVSMARMSERARGYRRG